MVPLFRLYPQHTFTLINAGESPLAEENADVGFVLVLLFLAEFVGEGKRVGCWSDGGGTKKGIWDVVGGGGGIG